MREHALSGGVGLNRSDTEDEFCRVFVRWDGEDQMPLVEALGGLSGQSAKADKSSVITTANPHVSR